MTQSDSARGALGKKKKSPMRRADGPSRQGTQRAPKAGAPSLLVPVRRLERTRRLLLAALRVWELKRRIRD
jgi:hypothetical protein